MPRALRHQPVRDQHAVLRVEYDGGPFHGWTRQPGGRPTVESELLAGFERLRCHDVQLRCAGRTDAGVHATGQVVDARFRGSVPIERLAVALSGVVRRELAVVASAPAPDGFNARADATSRAYEYRVLPRHVASPTRAAHVLHHPRLLDRRALDQAAAAALGRHCFTAFTPSRTAHVFFHRTLAESRWIERGDELVYQVRGNAFLRHMVRILVGTMLAIARGEAELESFRAMLAGAPRRQALQAAPPHGLCLVDVTWDEVAGLPLPRDWAGPRVLDAALRPQVRTRS